MLNRTLILLCSFLFFASVSQAKKETWYWGLSLGAANATFSGSKNTTIATLSADPAYTSSSLASELSFYWPAGTSGLLGIVSGGGGKSFYNSSNQSLNQNFGQSLLTLSWLQSLGREPGLGFLLRADAGYGVIYQTTGTSVLNLSGSETGTAVRGGLGYGFPLSEETRLLILLTSGSVFVGGGFSYYAVSAGLLF